MKNVKISTQITYNQTNAIFLKSKTHINQAFFLTYE
jgi:hypothetical protein